MKILVFAYDLVLSGVTVNVIELSAALRDLHGHDVVLFAAPGPLARLATNKQLRVISAPPAHGSVHPSVPRMRALRDVMRRERPDLIHAWDWVQCLDSYYVEHLYHRVPLLVSDMDMTLQQLLPRTLPVTWGTPELVERARLHGRKMSQLLVPPVDVEENAPGAVDGGGFRERYGIDASELVLVIVSRLDSGMKAESLFGCVEAVRTLGRDLPLRLVMVGDGDLHQPLAVLAEETNVLLGRRAVTLTGALVDPRPAYAAADVVIGMGGSALRGMAFAKPVIIIGVGGFCTPFTTETADSFYYRGMYGVGEGTSVTAPLVEHIRHLASQPRARTILGDFGRDFVVKRFALPQVSHTLSDFCHVATHSRAGFAEEAGDALRTATIWIRERRFLPYGSSLRARLRRTRMDVPAIRRT